MGLCIIFSNLSFTLKNDVNIIFLYHLTFSISFKVAAPHSTALHCCAMVQLTKHLLLDPEIVTNPF